MNNPILTTEICLYKIFKPLAYKLFDYANGQINPINKCDRLEINFSKEPGLLGKTQTDIVVIYLGEIINFVLNYKKYESGKEIISATATLLIITIFHELAHSEQILYMEAYNEWEKYFINTEESADLVAYHFLLDHKKDIARIIPNIDIIINDNFIRTYSDTAVYYKLPSNNYEFLYKLLIINGIVKVLDEDCSNIIAIIDGSNNVDISINNEKVSIKQCGSYIPDNYFVLRDIISRNIMIYDYVNYNTTIKRNKEYCILDFQFSGIIEPVVFNEEDKNND